VFCDDFLKVESQVDEAQLTHVDVKEPLANMAAKCQLLGLYQFRDVLIERKKQSSIALNTQLLLEDLLILWKKAF